jgi:hypothetical protein
MNVGYHLALPHYYGLVLSFDLMQFRKSILLPSLRNKAMKSPDSKNIISIIISLIIILFACKKSTESNPGNGSGTVQGVITDLNNSPVGNATVTGGSATATTDASGKFTLTKVQFSSNTVVVIVTKDGFFEGSKKFEASNNTVSNVKIQLIPKTVLGTFAASSGGNITIPGGGSVNFGSGFITASNGNAYTGTVSVSAFYLDPSDPNFSAYAPGNLKAISSNNQPGTLQSLGAVIVEMNDAAGNKLQLANGNKAILTTPIPSALQDVSPPAMLLWYFDDKKGEWKQEGLATRQSSTYVGLVSHFTSWNSGYAVDTSQYIRLTINGISYSATLPNYAFWGYRRPDTASMSTTELYSDTLGKNPAFDMAFTIMHSNISSGNIPAGNYPCGFLTTMNRVIYTTEYFNNRPQTIITEYGPVGGYITGSASGSVFRELSPGVTDATPLPFTCSYKILRIQ